jgi:hypothetical protein
MTSGMVSKLKILYVLGDFYRYRFSYQFCQIAQDVDSSDVFMSCDSLELYVAANQTKPGSKQTRQTHSWLQHGNNSSNPATSTLVRHKSLQFSSILTALPTMDPYSPEGG